MSFISFIKKILPSYSKEQQEVFIEIENIFRILQKLSSTPESIYNFTDKFQSIYKSKKINDRRFIKLYLSWEDFLISDNDSRTAEKITKQSLRARIAKEVDIQKINPSFRLIFLPERKQAIRIYEIFIQDIVSYIIQNSGVVQLQQTLDETLDKTIFESIIVSEDGQIDFTDFNIKHFESDLSLREITVAFRNLYGTLFNIIEGSFGSNIASGFFNTIYKTLQETYNQEFASIFLQVIPERVLGFDEWLSSLSKQELERQIRSKTKELNELNQSLETKVEERTKQLEEAVNNLTKANEELTKLDKQKSEFISVAAHQLRTPLSGIKWTLDMLAQEDLGKLNAEQKEYVQKMYATNENVINIVSDLLNTDEISSGKSRYSIENFNIFEVIDNILYELSDIAKQKDITLTIKDRNTSIGTLEGDKARIESVLQNIIENAVKYTKNSSEVIITVTKEGAFVKVAVTDQGIGIPKESQKSIFTRFYRAPNAIRLQNSGTGLGLFIAKGVVEHHGGKIWFESEENKGTTFYVTLRSRQPRNKIV